MKLTAADRQEKFLKIHYCYGYTGVSYPHPLNDKARVRVQLSWLLPSISDPSHLDDRRGDLDHF